MFICLYCGRLFESKSGCTYHERYCKINPAAEINPTSTKIWITDCTNQRLININCEIPAKWYIGRPMETGEKISKSNIGKLSWIKGLSAETDSRILSGERHPMFGKHLSDETKKKISDSESGENHWNFGGHHSAETKARIGAGNAGKVLSEDTRKKNFYFPLEFI